MGWQRRYGFGCSFRQMVALGFLALCFASGLSAQARPAWAMVDPPRVLTLEAVPGNPDALRVSFSMLTGSEGADRVEVVLLDAQGIERELKVFGRARSAERSADFTPGASGRYTILVRAARRDEAEMKYSELYSYNFVLPLAAPVFSIRNAGDGRLRLDWEAVAEADSYLLSLAGETGRPLIYGPFAGTETGTLLPPLETGRRYAATLAARRGPESAESREQLISIRSSPDRVWNFTWFGQSSNAALNRLELLDADQLSFRIFSATARADGTIDQKGGKFTTFHDGISFYYSVVDPDTENFELSATFTVDYINPTADGQEGFGLLALDSLGSHGVSAVNHYTNSAGIIATKFEETLDGVKYTSKDTLGSRFVWGLTPEVLAGGDNAIAQYAQSQSRGFDYTPEALVRAGRSYRLTLIKDNTGYHTRYEDPQKPEAGVVVRTLYGPEKLRSLDPEHVYVGFAVARGVNATVSDVVFTTTEPAADPPGHPEPPLYLPLQVKINSPSSYGSTEYPLSVAVNADGRLTVRDGGGRLLVDSASVKAGSDFRQLCTLSSGATKFRLSFIPDPAYQPAPKTVMGVWRPATQEYGPVSQPLETDFTVYQRSYPGTVIHVSPRGNALGTGSPERPLTLAMALAFMQPGQEILLQGGIYRMQTGIVIERGNSGSRELPKVLRVADGQTAVLDFSMAGAGMQLWGDWWHISGIEIRNTPGNTKGLQVAGSHNIIRSVRTCYNGDTGLQISGSSTEPFEKWPAYNLVENCSSHDNKDPASNNADGFAAKLTSGPGNVFRGCIAYGNIDDGWDLFSKIETGAIGTVLIENSVAYRNGSLSDGSGNGDGNGFKLGGDGIAVEHVLRNCLAFENGSTGITSNSNPALIVEACTAYGNKAANFSLYGKDPTRLAFRVSSIVSMAGGSADNIPASVLGGQNFFWNGASCQNSEGESLTRSNLQQLQPAAVLTTPAPTAPYAAPLVLEFRRKADGTVDFGGLFALESGQLPEVGYRP